MRNRYLYLLVFAILMWTLGACMKDKIPTLIKPKTTADYIRQMVGTHKMVGQSDYRSPGLDTITKIVSYWTIESPSSSSFIVKTATGGSATFYFIKNDSANNRLTFTQSPAKNDEDDVYYYHLRDSLVYYGYTKTSMTTYREDLHSEK